MADQEKENEATPTKEPYSSKYAVFCGKVYDACATFWRGKREHTPETLLLSRKRGTWIVTAFIVFAIIGAFTDDEEEASGEVAAEVPYEEVYVDNGNGEVGAATTDNDYALKDLGVKIKSVCGFKFGATREQCKQLLYDIEESLDEDISPYVNNNEGIQGRLKEPWRRFTRVRLAFTTVDRVPPHLWRIRLESDILDFSKISEDSCEEEVLKVKKLVEKKFGIKLKGSTPTSRWYRWSGDDIPGTYDSKEYVYGLLLNNISRNEGRIELDFRCPLVIHTDEAIQREQGEKINISADEGADQL